MISYYKIVPLCLSYLFLHLFSHQ